MAKLKSTLLKTVAKLLKPIAKMVLERGVSHAEFSEITKQVFIEVANEKLADIGEKQTTSQISVFTGLARKDVARIRAISAEEIEATPRRNRQVDVIDGWLRDSDFLDDKGTPKALPYKGDISFSTLVKRYAGDVTTPSVLNELIRIGVAEKEEDVVTLKNRGYVPENMSEERLRIVEEHGRDLLNTLCYNMDHTPGRLQMAVVSKALPQRALLPLHKLAATESKKLLEVLDQFIADNEVTESDFTTDQGNEDTYRAGLGLYYFEEPDEKP